MPNGGVFKPVIDLASFLLIAERRAGKTDWLDGFRDEGLPDRLKCIAMDQDGLFADRAVAGALLAKFYVDVYQDI